MFATVGVMHWNLVGVGSFLLMGMRKDVCNVWSLAPEINCVSLLPSNGNEKRRLKHLESNTAVWFSKTVTFVMGMKKMFESLGIMHCSLGG